MKELIPAANAIAGVVIGYLLRTWGDSRRDKKKLRSIKMLLSDEMIDNYKKIIIVMPLETKNYLDTYLDVTMALAHQHTLLSCSVYNGYIEYMCDLGENETHALSKAYRTTMDGMKKGAEVMKLFQKNAGEPTDPEQEIYKHLLAVSTETLNHIREAILLIDEVNPFFWTQNQEI